MIAVYWWGCRQIWVQKNESWWVGCVRDKCALVYHFMNLHITNNLSESTIIGGTMQVSINFFSVIVKEKLIWKILFLE